MDFILNMIQALDAARLLKQKEASEWIQFLAMLIEL